MTKRRGVLAALLAFCAVLVLACGPGVQDYSYDVSGGYKVFRSSAHEVSIVSKAGWSGPMPGVPAKVVEVAWDERFILAKQQHLRPRGTQDGYAEPVRGQFSYWVIDVQGSARHGPLGADGFAAKRSELGVPPALELRDVRSYPKDQD